MSIDTHLDATPSDITASAIKIGNLKTAVDNSIDHLANARKDAGSLEGESATGAQNLINSAVKTCEGMVKDLTNYKNALDNLGSWSLSRSSPSSNHQVMPMRKHLRHTVSATMTI